MSPAGLTVKILQEIRDELRSSRQEQRSFREETSARFEAIDQRFEAANQRFEVIETTLRDLAQQMVMVGRGIRVLIDGRGSSDARIDALESRVDALETKVS